MNTQNINNIETETLFTIQMGTNEEKKKLFDKILGSDLESSRKVINEILKLKLEIANNK